MPVAPSSKLLFSEPQPCHIYEKPLENEVVAELVLLQLRDFIAVLDFSVLGGRVITYMQRQVTRENMDSRIVDLAPAAKR